MLGHLPPYRRLLFSEVDGVVRGYAIGNVQLLGEELHPAFCKVLNSLPAFNSADGGDDGDVDMFTAGCNVLPCTCGSCKPEKQL